MHFFNHCMWCWHWHRYSLIELQGKGKMVCPSAGQRVSSHMIIISDIMSILSNVTVSESQTVDCPCQQSSQWTQIAYLDMTDPSQTCPGNWRLVSGPERSCGRTSTSSNGCDSAVFDVHGLQYSQVCGRVIGYQVGNPDAFGSGTTSSIDSYYVEGVSITHGRPRTHIWTFAAAYDELRTNRQICPCTNPALDGFRIPTFVGEDYFCETGVPPGEEADPDNDLFYSDDPLWDGDGCGPTSTCCTFNNPPWFCKELPQATTENIEVRICAATGRMITEDTPIQLLELYVMWRWLR